MRHSKNIIALLVAVFVTSSCFSQNEIQHTHAIGLRAGLFNTFDGVSMVQPKQVLETGAKRTPLRFASYIGANYLKQYNSRNRFKMSVMLGTYSNSKDIVDLTKGSIDEIGLLDLSLSNEHILSEIRRHKFYLINGVSIRGFYESMIANIGIIGTVNSEPIYELHFESKSSLDIGVMTGLKYHYSVSKRISFAAELDYKFYALTYYNKHYKYNIDRGVPRNLALLKIGVDYHFGNREDGRSILNEGRKFQKNNFYVQRTIYNLFNDEPSIQPRNNDLGFGPNLSQSFGISYQRRLGMKNYIVLSLEDYEFRNSVPDHETGNGDTKARSFIGAGLEFQRSLKDFSSSMILGGLGVYYRHGLEYFVGDMAPDNDANRWSKKELRDIGLNASLRYQLFMGNHINLNSKVGYTYFVYTNDKKGTTYVWDRNPTNQMISLSLGIGFNYGE